ncbi:Mannose glucose-specific lectin, partial [Musa troglodytarum]
KAIKAGPWGGNGGILWDTGIVDSFIKFKVYYGDEIDGLDITYIQNRTIKTLRVGGPPPVSNEITLDEDENFTSITGYFKPMLGTDIFITQLTLTTDKDRNVSAGNETGNPFSLTLEEGGHIVGFWGLVGQSIVAVEAIAVYCSLADS